MSVVSTDTDIPDDIEYYYTDNSAASSVVNEKDEEEAKKMRVTQKMDQLRLQYGRFIRSDQLEVSEFSQITQVRVTHATGCKKDKL